MRYEFWLSIDNILVLFLIFCLCPPPPHTKCYLPFFFAFALPIFLIKKNGFGKFFIIKIIKNTTALAVGPKGKKKTGGAKG
jgi:hypothetical protein